MGAGACGRAAQPGPRVGHGVDAIGEALQLQRRVRPVDDPLRATVMHDGQRGDRRVDRQHLSAVGEFREGVVVSELEEAQNKLGELKKKQAAKAGSDTPTDADPEKEK